MTRVASPPKGPPPRRRWRRIVARGFEVGVVLVALGTLLLWCSVPNTDPLATRNPRSTAFIDLRRAEAAAAGRSFELRWDWRPLGKISRYLRAAVIYAEDYAFYRHDGIDWNALGQALESNWEHESMAIGGSTITQQLAKNLYLSPDRSLVRKAREMLIAYALEDHLSKLRILEIYLNVVEWGDGIFGAEAAAKRWYGRSAQTLTPAQAVRLACALPNPFTRAPTVKSAKLTNKAVRLIRLLRAQGLIDAPQERVALDEVGAPNEKVLPDRRASPPATIAPDAGPSESLPLDGNADPSGLDPAPLDSP